MDNMPPLPEPDVRSLTVYFTDDGHRHSRAFTADQMHAYARAYAEQRCAPLVEALQSLMDPATYEDGEWYREAREKARAALAAQEQSK